MTIPFSDVVRSTFLGGLGELSTLLAEVEARAADGASDADALLNARLYDDMFTFAQQIQSATDTARRVTDRLAGGEPSSRPDPETTVAALKARIDETIAHVTAADAAALDASVERVMEVNLGQGPMSFTGRAYVLGFAIPNLLFHVTTAYGILRSQGSPLGKARYIVPFMQAVAG